MSEQRNGFVVSFTGHRPQKLRNHDLVRASLREALERLRAEHPGINAICGGALGVDTWAADTCIELGIPFRLILPFPPNILGAKWAADDRAKLRQHIAGAVKTAVVAREYSVAAYQRRNEAMVDRCDLLIAYYNGSPGGTRNCIRYAREKGREVLNLCDTPTEHEHAPAETTVRVRKIPEKNARASVSIRLGMVGDTPTAEARVTMLAHIVDEFGVRRWVEEGEPLFTIQRTVYLEEFPPLRPRRQNPLAKQLNRPDRRHQYGRLFFAMQAMVKEELQKTRLCWVCGQGEVYFRRVKVGEHQAIYHASWKKLVFEAPHTCHRCWEKSHPTRGIFNPAPEADREDSDYPSDRDNIFMDAVNELGRIPRDQLLEDIEFGYALDAQATKEYLSGVPVENEEFPLAGTAGQAAVELLVEEVRRKEIWK